MKKTGIIKTCAIAEAFTLLRSKRKRIQLKRRKLIAVKKAILQAGARKKIIE
jgi:hypothetical protein